jgi:hypothetical protein
LPTFVHGFPDGFPDGFLDGFLDGVLLVGFAGVGLVVMAGLAVLGLRDVGLIAGLTVLGLLVVGFFIITDGTHAPTVSELPENGHHKLVVAALK